MKVSEILCLFLAAMLFCSVQRTAYGKQELNAKTSDPCEGINLALKYKKGDLTTYRVISDNQRQAIWEGPISQRPEGFVGGRTGSRVEITFQQRIMNVNEKGDAVMQIKITGIKANSVTRDVNNLDFDSTKNKDPNRPLAKLLGSNYTIEVSSFGQILQINDINNVRTGVINTSVENQLADSLLAYPAIKERHTIISLASSGRTPLKKGASWTMPETIDFDLMGKKEYEKTYTFEGIVKEKDGREIAVVKMKAVAPSQVTTGPLSIDTQENYTGLLRLDPKTGTIEQNREELATEWIVQADSQPPQTLRISATRLKSFEKIVEK